MSIKLTIDESVFEYSEGTTEVEVTGKTVGECLIRAVKSRSGLEKALFYEGRIYPGNMVQLNGTLIYPDPLDVAVKDGDAVKIVRLTGG